MLRFLFIFILLLLPNIAAADPLTIDIGSTGINSKVVQIIALITVLSLAPSITVMVTSFTRIVVVLSFVRSAIGLQQTPPNPVLISLALFMSGFIMAPTFEESYTKGVGPLIREEISEDEAFPIIAQPFHKFMMGQVREKDLGLFLNIADKAEVNKEEEVPYTALIPAFMISELHRAFEIGFLIFLAISNHRYDHFVDTHGHGYDDATTCNSIYAI